MRNKEHFNQSKSLNVGHAVAWQNNFELFKEFIAEFGRMPKGHETYRGANIGQWCQTQKRSYNAKKLSDVRARELMEAGFDFAPVSTKDEQAWEKKFQLYRAFKAEYKREPKSSEVYRGFNIGLWCNKQIQSHNAGTLSLGRLQKLQDAGFVFARQETYWQKNFELYKAFKAEHGREPLRFEVYCGVNLGEWCTHQKRKQKTGKLSVDRMQTLLDAEFDFESQEAKDERVWQEHFELYKAFKDEFEREPKQGEIYQGANIGNWRNAQTSNYNAGKLPLDRVQKLQAVGFVFNRFENTWRESLELYQSFVEEYGREPRVKEVYLGQNIGLWCHHQRTAFNAGTLSQERMQLLVASGFSFYTMKEYSQMRFARAWQENLELYKTFKAEYGREPILSETFRGKRIGVWCNNTKAAYKAGKLSVERVQELVGAGFEFGRKMSLEEKLAEAHGRVSVAETSGKHQEERAL